jgi:hypothetical protein
MKALSETLSCIVEPDRQTDRQTDRDRDRDRRKFKIKRNL